LSTSFTIISVVVVGAGFAVDQFLGIHHVFTPIAAMCVAAYGVWTSRPKLAITDKK